MWNLCQAQAGLGLLTMFGMSSSLCKPVYTYMYMFFTGVYCLLFTEMHRVTDVCTDTQAVTHMCTRFELSLRCLRRYVLPCL